MSTARFASQIEFERAAGFYNIKADGATGDGTTDDTVAIQTTLNRFTNGVAGTASGHVYFPKGTYKITAPLVYGGGLQYGLHIEGSVGSTRGPSGTEIAWYGPSGGTMLILSGANGTTLEHLEFDGRGISKYGVHLTATNHVSTTLGTVVTPGSVEVTPAAMDNIDVGTLLNVDTGASLEYVYVTAVTGSTFTATFVKSHGSSAVVGGSVGSSDVTLRRLTITGSKGTGSAALAIGNVTSSDTHQISEVDMYDLYLAGDGDGTTGAGIKTLGAGNMKNFKMHGGIITTVQYGVDWINASGVFRIDGTTFLGTSVADVRMGAATMFLSGTESENDNDAGGLFVTGTTGSNQGSLVVIGSSWEGHLGTDDVLIRYSGNITLIGNRFNNYRTGSSIPKIESTSLFSDATPSTLFSQGNFYHNATAGLIPVITAAAADVFAAAKGLISITSLGDYGGDGGALVKLTNFIPVGVQAHQIIATGSLPAAATTENGRIVIEDNGAGDRNLIIYAGGQRFRIDGGTAF